MKVLIVSEGKNEIGAAPRDGMPQPKGALTVLVERLLERDIELEWLPVSDSRVMGYFVAGKTPMSTQYFKRAMAWVGYALEKGFEALVLVVDEDGYRERRTGIRLAQAETRVLLPRAMGVAIRTFDAWILADEEALSKVLGAPANRQRNPEDIHRPKERCEALGLKGKYPMVAEVVDLKLLESRCPKGFRPFAERVRRLKFDPPASGDAARLN
jgi:hypothetical protein